VSTIVKIQSVNTPKELLQSDKQSHVTKQDCKIADGTGLCRLVLWADHSKKARATTEECGSVIVQNQSTCLYLNTRLILIIKLNDIGPVNDRCITTGKKHCG
jgi:hypothetical protein